VQGADHEFGGVSTDLKLSLVEGYLSAFTAALRSKFDHLWYLDAFAGTGERTVRIAARKADLLGDDQPVTIERRRGSARIAIEIRPSFDRLLFMEKRPRYCAALAELRSQHPDRRIEIIRGDANEAIRTELLRNSWSGIRAVMFLDPYGMAVDWRTIESIRATEAIDVWYLVSLAGLFRQAARDPEKIDADKRASITRMLGTDEWQSAWYARKSPSDDLFGPVEDETIRRIADVADIEAFVGKRLRGLFPKVLAPATLGWFRPAFPSDYRVMISRCQTSNG